jgi:hypothetical protein
MFKRIWRNNDATTPRAKALSPTGEGPIWRAGSMKLRGATVLGSDLLRDGSWPPTAFWGVTPVKSSSSHLDAERLHRTCEAKGPSRPSLVGLG